MWQKEIIECIVLSCFFILGGRGKWGGGRGGRGWGGGRGKGEGGGDGEGRGARGWEEGKMLRVWIDRRTNICSPTVFLCLKHSLFLPHHKWHKFVWKSNLRMFFWWIQKRVICIYCGISNLICSCISFFISVCISLFNLSKQSVNQS